jgi:hypothetical protein
MAHFSHKTGRGLFVLDRYRLSESAAGWTSMPGIGSGQRNVHQTCATRFHCDRRQGGVLSMHWGCKVAKPDFFAGLQGVERLPYPRDQINFRSLHAAEQSHSFYGRALCTL